MNTTDREIKHQDGQITWVFHVTMPKYDRVMTVGQHQEMLEEHYKCCKIMADAKRSYLIAIDKIEKGLPAQSDVVFAGVSGAEGSGEPMVEYFPKSWDETTAPKVTATQIDKRISRLESSVAYLKRELNHLKLDMLEWK